MGSRASYIITERGRHEIFYSHWGAQQVTRDFFFGPEAACAVIRSTKPTDELLDDVWAEGGAAVDFDRKRLRLWGGEDMQYDVGQRQFWLELLGFSWPTWDVAWADHGIYELADQIGVPRRAVRARQVEQLADTAQLKSAKPPHFRNTLVTIRDLTGSLHDVFVIWRPEHLLDRGLEILEKLSALPGAPISPEYSDDGWAHHCIYFDVAAKTVWAHVGSTFDPDLSGTGRPGWAGWNVHYHALGVAHHLELTRRDPEPLRQPSRDHIKAVGHFVMSRDVDPKRMLDIMARHDSADAKEIIVNPAFLQVHFFEMSEDDRMDRFLKVLSIWQAEQGRHPRGRFSAFSR